MSQQQQKEAIKVTIREGVLPKNVPVVDQYLKDYSSNKSASTGSQSQKTKHKNMNSSITVSVKQKQPDSLRLTLADLMKNPEKGIGEKALDKHC